MESKDQEFVIYRLIDSISGEEHVDVTTREEIDSPAFLLNVLGNSGGSTELLVEDYASTEKSAASKKKKLESVKKYKPVADYSDVETRVEAVSEEIAAGEAEDMEETLIEEASVEEIQSEVDTVKKEIQVEEIFTEETKEVEKPKEDAEQKQNRGIISTFKKLFGIK